MSLTADMPDVLFSTDGGATWNAQPVVKLSDGEARVMVKSDKQGKVTATAVGEDCAPGTLDMTFIEQAEVTKVMIEFTDDQGNKKQYEIDIQQKPE
jgi:hypothetical protein